MAHGHSRQVDPLLLVGLGIAIAFRGGVINIGAEGQLIVGALLTTLCRRRACRRLSPCFRHPDRPSRRRFHGRRLGHAIPGYLKARLGVNEILSTIMMNQIAIQIGYYLLRRPMIDPAELAAGTNIPQSARLPRTLDMPRFTDLARWLGIDRSAADLELDGYLGQVYGAFVEPSRLHSGLILAIIMAILVYVLLWRTTLGYRIRAVGLSRSASEYAGIHVGRTMVLSMTLSGMFAGLAGAVEILGCTIACLSQRRFRRLRLFRHRRRSIRQAAPVGHHPLVHPLRRAARRR
jgi:general nucleoside transport system permease protein